MRALWISADDGQRECAGARGIISFRLYNIARDIDVPSPNTLYSLILCLLLISVITKISIRVIHSSPNYKIMLNIFSSKRKTLLS